MDKITQTSLEQQQEPDSSIDVEQSPSAGEQR